MANNDSIVLLPWDSDFFGLRIGRLNVSQSTKSPSLKDFDLVYAFVEKGMLLPSFNSDVCVTKMPHRVDLRKRVVSQLKFPEWVEISEEFNEDIVRIALLSGWKSRFFLDEKLKGKAPVMYREWAKKYFNGQGRTFVIKEEGVAVGMINCLLKIGRLDIGLFAVAEEARGRGYGRNLLSAVEFFAHECRVDEISVSTQLENIPAMSLYQEMGYKIFETQQVYHIWNKKEEKTNENPF